MLVLRSEDIVKDWLVLQVANAYEAQQMESMAREGFGGLSSIKIGIFFTEIVRYNASHYYRRYWII